VVIVSVFDYVGLCSAVLVSDSVMFLSVAKWAQGVPFGFAHELAHNLLEQSQQHCIMS
jgi:hypothetical protein